MQIIKNIMTLFVLTILQTQSVYPCDDGVDSVGLAPLHRFVQRCERAEQFHAEEKILGALYFLRNHFLEYSNSRWSEEYIVQLQGVHPELVHFINCRNSLEQDVASFLHTFLKLRGSKGMILLELYTLLHKASCPLDKSDDDEGVVLEVNKSLQSVRDALQNLCQGIRNYEDLVVKNAQYLTKEKENIIAAVTANVSTASDVVSNHLAEYKSYCTDTQELLQQYRVKFGNALTREKIFSQKPRWFQTFDSHASPEEFLQNAIMRKGRDRCIIVGAVFFSCVAILGVGGFRILFLNLLER